MLDLTRWKWLPILLFLARHPYFTILAQCIFKEYNKSLDIYNFEKSKDIFGGKRPKTVMATIDL